MALLFLHENFWKNWKKRFKRFLKVFIENNSAIVFPAQKYRYEKIFMNFDNKIKNDFWAQDPTRASMSEGQAR